MARGTILSAAECIVIKMPGGRTGDVKQMTKLLRVGGCVLAVMLGMGMAQGQQATDASNAAGETILLWPNGAPGAKGDTDADKPSLTVYLPSGANETKTGVVIAPGGGYEHLAIGYEGTDAARWLNARGVAAFVLKYRLGPTYHNPIELGDAQRAIRLVRAHAEEYGIATDHIGMWGFSAGGHLTATAGTHFDKGNPSATDPIDRQGCRPDFLILAYPVITMEAPYAHKGSFRNLLGENPSPDVMRALSAELNVTKDTPPTFLFSTTDDKTVPVMNSVMFYTALVKAGVPAEMHLFQHGKHGSGLGVGNPGLSVWPDLLIKWMRERGYAAPVGAAVGQTSSAEK
jgi:acetyl esterase/lipase